MTDPQWFSVHIDSAHGWVMGLIHFFLGLVLVSTQEIFRPGVARVRWRIRRLADAVFGCGPGRSRRLR